MTQIEICNLCLVCFSGKDYLFGLARILVCSSLAGNGNWFGRERNHRINSINIYEMSNVC